MWLIHQVVPPRSVWLVKLPEAPLLPTACQAPVSCLPALRSKSQCHGHWARYQQRPTSTETQDPTSSQDKVSRDVRVKLLSRLPHNTSVMLTWWGKRQSQGWGYPWSMAVSWCCDGVQPQTPTVAWCRIASCQTCFAVCCCHAPQEEIAPTSAYHNGGQSNIVTVCC